MNFLLKRSLAVLIVLTLILLLASCNKEGDNSEEPDGKSAYELAVENGYNGTLNDWLASLVGNTGADGKSAYELAVENGYNGTLNDWLASLVGNTGADGKSAYELYKEKYGYKGTEDEWLFDLVNGNLSVKHTVTFNPENGRSSFTQSVGHGEKIVRPDNPTRAGYVFAGWVCYDGVELRDWEFLGYTVTEDVTLIATWDYATYELPIINIDTDGADINSKVTYTDMIFDIENCDDELSNISGGIRLRGNSTSVQSKRPYRIKFDKKQSLFGLDKAKSWVLLAEYLDPSALHNYTAFSIANQLPGLDFTPSPYKVNVYLNGEYVGLYTLCEQVQENEGRMDIEMDEITADMTDLKDFNFFVCMDYSAKSDPEAVLGETYFYVSKYNQYFELKYPEKDQFTSDEQFESFFSQLKVYVEEVMDDFSEQNIEEIKSEVNLNSLADFLIIDQIMGEKDHRNKSFNMYYTCTSSDESINNKLNFGPIWDYDWCLYTAWTGVPNQIYNVVDTISYSNLFFQTMASVPEFYSLVKERYQLYAKDALENYINDFDGIVESIEVSLELNQQLCYSRIDDGLTEDNINFLKDFLERRKELLDELWLDEDNPLDS